MNHLSRIIFREGLALVGILFLLLTPSQCWESQVGSMGLEYYSVTKSQCDNREYRGLILPNKLQVLLVHDPDSEKGAAAMDVHVGHFSDPSELPGLAHFCEHMLFLGTEKYPDENHYGHFLSTNGGRSNASTGTEHTNYYFDVAHTHFFEALDIFAQFFIAPLFTEDATDRELTAIQNENAKNLQEDGWRAYQLSKSTSNPDFPFSKFATGNRATLDSEPKKVGVDTRAALLEFHSKYYSANIMKLAVVSRQSLDEMETAVVERFSAIPNMDVDIPFFQGKPYNPEHLQKFFRVVPVKDIRSVDIFFPMPERKSKFRSKPDSYLSHFLGHEGPGSVLSLLKKRGWATGLSAGATHSTTMFSIFYASIELTVDGLENVDKVVAMVFQYVRLLKEDGAIEWVFQEISKINELNFRFKSKNEPISYVGQLSSYMQGYPKEDVLSGPWLSTEFKPDLIRSHMDLLSIENSRVYVFSRDFKDETDTKETWYQTDYSVRDYTPEQIALWKSGAIDPELGMPGRNEFVPTDLDLKPAPATSGTAGPSLLSQSRGHKLWHKQDVTFKRPKADVKIQMASPVAYESPESTVLTQMYTLLVEEALNEFSYDADLAGLRYSLSHTIFGMSLTVSGYNDKLSVLVSKILTTLKNLETDVQRFNMIHEQTLRDYKNFAFEAPYQLASYYNSVFLEQRKWPVNDKIVAIQNISADDLQIFAKRLFRRMHVEILCHGNMNEEDAHNILDVAQKEIGYEPLLPSEQIETRLVNLEPNSFTLQHISAVNSEEMNNAIELYYQIGLENTRDDVLADLMTQVVKEPCFDQLRTKEQLGYIVFFGVKSIHGVQGFRFLIQSSGFSPDHLYSRVENFKKEYRSTLGAMDDATFNKNRDALILKKKEKPKHLSEQTQRYWREITNHQHVFDRRDKEIALLETLKLADLTAFYDRIFNEANKKCGVFMFGKSHPADSAQKDLDGARLATDIYAEKRRLAYYPHNA